MSFFFFRDQPAGSDSDGWITGNRWQGSLVIVPGKPVGDCDCEGGLEGDNDEITPYGEAQANGLISEGLKTAIAPDFFFK